MSAAGWYPDPDGTPGRYRYWDGQSWSSATTDDPRTTPPEGGARRAAGYAAAGGTAHPTRAAQERHRSRRVPLIILAAIVLLIIVGVGGVIALRGAGWSATDPPPPTVSAWDDSSPTPTARPTPSPSPSPRPSPSAGQVRCPVGDPDAGPDDPDDGRVHGGRLSFAMVDGYGEPQPRSRLSWFYDTASQLQITEPGWASSFTVGEVERAESFGTLQQAAEHTLQCMIAGDGFEGFSGRKDLGSEARKVDDREAWMITTEVRVDRDDISVDGDRVVVIFVDDGRKDRMSAFVGLVPIGDQDRIAIMDRVIKDLRVDQ